MMMVTIILSMPYYYWKIKNVFTLLSSNLFNLIVFSLEITFGDIKALYSILIILEL